MIRFAWLQARNQTLVATAALAALAVIAGITGVHLAHLYTSLVTDCQSNCSLATSQFLTHGHFMDHVLTIVAQLAPAVIGIFWGAPLLTRELETGTYRVAWTQSVSRSRWLVTKLATVGLAAVVVAGVLTLTITWWYRTLDPLTTNQYLVFDERGIAPIGYAAFAFASGALIGAVVRRTLPAMATTIAVFVAVRVAITLWVRPHLLAPIHKTMSLLHSGGFGITSNNGSNFQMVAQGSGPYNAWTLSSRLVTNSGQVVSSSQLTAFVRQYCPKIVLPSAPTAGHAVVQPPGPAIFDACHVQAARQFHLLVTYQPANRYWTFQWCETGIFFASPYSRPPAAIGGLPAAPPDTGLGECLRRSDLATMAARSATLLSSKLDDRRRRRQRRLGADRLKLCQVMTGLDLDNLDVPRGIGSRRLSRIR